MSDAHALIEQVVVRGDLSKLTPEERSKYYFEVCRSAGLNPLTKPFEYITLNGRLVLYALRACTDQLRTIHGVSVEELTEAQRGDIFIVTAKVKHKDGRTDMAKGAINTASLKGEALANAIMKAETKAKRRATLSLCGLGLLDETEVETMPGAKIETIPAPISGAIAPQDAEPPQDPEAGEVKSQPVAQRSEKSVTITAEIRMETEKALQLDDGKHVEWLPKTQVENHGDGTFTIPRWVAKKKGFTASP